MRPDPGFGPVSAETALFRGHMNPGRCRGATLPALIVAALLTSCESPELPDLRGSFWRGTFLVEETMGDRFARLECEAALGIEGQVLEVWNGDLDIGPGASDSCRPGLVETSVPGTTRVSGKVDLSSFDRKQCALYSVDCEPGSIDFTLDDVDFAVGCEEFAGSQRFDGTLGWILTAETAFRCEDRQVRVRFSGFKQ